MSKYITKTHLQSFWTSLKSRLPALDAPLVNYIVEQGENSGWFYKKWSDGYCEAYYHLWQEGISSDGNKWITTTVTIPDGLFRTIDSVYTGASVSGDTNSLAGGCEWTTTQWTGHIKASWANTSLNVEANLYAVGWWR